MPVSKCSHGTRITSLMCAYFFADLAKFCNNAVHVYLFTYILTYVQCKVREAVTLLSGVQRTCRHVAQASGNGFYHISWTGNITYFIYMFIHFVVISLMRRTLPLPSPPPSSLLPWKSKERIVNIHSSDFAKETL